MTYPPANPGFSPAQPPGSPAPSGPSFAKSDDAENKLPFYLQIAVAALGVVTYLVNFGPKLASLNSDFHVPGGSASLPVTLAVGAGLLAAVGLLPKGKNYTAIVAVLAVLGGLLNVSAVFAVDESDSIQWGTWAVLVISVLQGAVAAGLLLLEAGVISLPAPRPAYDPYAQYGLPAGGSFYGQPGQGQPQPQPQQQSQQPGFGSFGNAPGAQGAPGGFGAPAQPSAPAGYGGPAQPAAPAQPSAPVAFGAPQPPADFAAPTTQAPQNPQTPSGPPTPPTGFPSFAPPPGAGSANPAGQGPQAPGAAPSGPTPS